MKNFTTLNTVKNKIYILIGAILFVALFLLSLLIGKFPLSIEKILAGDELQIKVFWTLRFSRAIVGCIGGFALGVAGFTFQTIFHNPLAAPDIIGVSSGASAGAAFGILFLNGMLSVTLSAFSGALIAVFLAVTIAAIDRNGKKSTVILAGIAVHSLAQTILMGLKMIADPEKQLASIEYWIMGSLNGINSHIIGWNLAICVFCLVVIFILHRQTLLLATQEAEAKMLGVNVNVIRFAILIISTLMVSSVVSLSGLISFVGLLAPHCARNLTHNNDRGTMFLSGLFGGIILCIADILARSVAATELPISIFTSLIGAPFLVFLIIGRRDKV